MQNGGMVCAVLFLLVGLIFVGYAGIQSDEAVFAAPLFRAWRFWGIPIGRHVVPVMNASYYGALKTWLDAPILLTFRPSAWGIRLPAILAGAITILIFWETLLRVHSRRAAWAGCLLLATDTSYLLTTTYDWGPVALQHLMLAGAMLFGVRWYQTGRSRALALARLLRSGAWEQGRVHLGADGVAGGFATICGRHSRARNLAEGRDWLWCNWLGHPAADSL